jgi:hypothetical protein
MTSSVGATTEDVSQNLDVFELLDRSTQMKTLSAQAQASQGKPNAQLAPEIHRVGPKPRSTLRLLYGFSVKLLVSTCEFRVSHVDFTFGGGCGPKPGRADRLHQVAAGLGMGGKVTSMPPCLFCTRRITDGIYRGA